MRNQKIQISDSIFIELQISLRRLIVEFGLVAFKSGTEVEDMTFEELAFLRRLTHDLLPLYVKIGGPEARNDMRACLNLGVDGIIAPMIESPFALYKFISSLKSIASEQQFQKIRKGINLESKCAVDNLDEIMSSPEALDLDQITAARSDLSASLGCDVNDRVVTSCCRSIVKYANKFEIESCVGGKMMPQTIENLIKDIPVGMVNTRHMVLSVPLIRSQAEKSVDEALNFEIELYKVLALVSGARNSLHDNRVKSLEKRLIKTNLLHT